MENENQKKIRNREVGLSILSIQSEGFELTEEGKALKGTPNREDYEFELTINQTSDIEEKTVNMLLELIIRSLSEKTTYAVFSMKMAFKIENFENFVHFKDDEPHIDTALLRMLASICTSTCRGMLVSVTAPTKFNNAILPVIDANSFYTDTEAQIYVNPETGQSSAE